MKKYFVIVILWLLFLGFGTKPIIASSQQAYQDYQYQFDLYRQRHADYQIARNQYNQFKSLAAQQDAIDKVKLYLAQRDMVGKTYFLFLNEKLNENPGLSSGEKAVYRAILTDQVAFLDQNVVFVPSIASLDDAVKVSEKFETNYETMQSAYRQIIASLELGYLNYFAKRFEDAAIHAQALINAARPDVIPEKQAILDRWLLALSNKRSLFQQKANTIRTSIPKIVGDVQQQDRLYGQVQNTINAARQDLVEASSYLKEIETALKYD
ncbi:MAG TPA: hypothetical protein VJB96_00480 [Patescibacteria group bacterium]|nr:hypothetical protein [Patescibacteria group bacterium]